ncbi:MAG: hypothetical protein JWO02_3536 [Solirubrobacterales bacterium]|nr:hypothetical protein [Solirubrobacterales bacterium]
MLLIGEGRLAGATERGLQDAGATVRRLHEPNDREVRDAVDDDVDRVVIAGAALAAAALGHDAREAFPYRDTMFLVDPSGDIAPFVPTDRRD